MVRDGFAAAPSAGRALQGVAATAVAVLTVLMMTGAPAAAQLRDSVNDVPPFTSCAGIDGFYTGRNAWGSISAINGAATQIGADPTLANFNGVGFNRRDGRLYVRAKYTPPGANGTQDVIAVLGSDGSFAVLPVVGLGSTDPYNGGDVDADGYLHVLTSGSATNNAGLIVRVIDVTPGRATFGTLVRTYQKQLSTDPGSASLPNANVGADVAFNLNDGLFYSMRDPERMVTMNPTTGEIRLVGEVGAGSTMTGAFGGQYFDPNGTLTLVNNNRTNTPLSRVALPPPFEVSDAGVLGQDDMAFDAASCHAIVPLPGAGAGNGGSGVAAVPTLNGWGLALLGVLAGAMGARRTSRRAGQRTQH